MALVVRDTLLFKMALCLRAFSIVTWDIQSDLLDAVTGGTSIAANNVSIPHAKKLGHSIITDGPTLGSKCVPSSDAKPGRVFPPNATQSIHAILLPAYATSVLAVALSYLQVGGRAPTVL